MSDDAGDYAELGLDNPWLLGGFSPFVSSRSGAPERWQEDAAVKALLAASMVIDGRKWLSGADFDHIFCDYSWRKGKSHTPRISVEFGHLTFEATVDPNSLPTEEEQLTVHLFRRVLDDLEYIASAMDLPRPSIAFEALVMAERMREAGGRPYIAEPDFPPPVSDDAVSDVGSELDALEPNEVLLVLQYRQDDETDGQAFNRRLLQEEALSRLLGAPLASSKCGGAYAIAYPLPPDEPPKKTRRSRRNS